jgi:hypothetical protein
MQNPPNVRQVIRREGGGGTARFLQEKIMTLRVEAAEGSEAMGYVRDVDEFHLYFGREFHGI